MSGVVGYEWYFEVYVDGQIFFSRFVETSPTPKMESLHFWVPGIENWVIADVSYQPLACLRDVSC